MKEIKKMEEVDIIKIGQIGEGFYEGHKNRTIYVPGKKLFMCYLERKNTMGHSGIIKNHEDVYCEAKETKSIDDLLIKELTGEILGMFCILPYSWTQTKTEVKLKQDSVNRLAKLGKILQKFRDAEILTENTIMNYEKLMEKYVQFEKEYKT